MKILIVENDRSARVHLEYLIKELIPHARVGGRCSSIEKARLWFSKNPPPDLIISAVKLPDGLTFELFRKYGADVPVIFTCAHDNYAAEAFKLNSLHYLVKPVKKEELKMALERYLQSIEAGKIKNSSHAIPVAPPHQQRFVVNTGKKMRLVHAEAAAYFFTEHKLVFMVTLTGEKYTTEYSLEQLEHILDPKIFFRINRQFIVNISSIVQMTPASKSRIKLNLKPVYRHETITSFERTPGFRRWLIGV